ncbi:acyl carrier protein [Streptomyces sp. NPDC005899]|uniref:acyl carrier protein n=1 Tax=Streptomyces sp. NPDC005899 TaxID=3155716 RepID=UPI0033EBF3BE
MSTIEERMKELVAKQLNVRVEEVANGMSFVEDMGADSLDTVELATAMEKEFGIEIPDGDAERCTTVQHALDYVGSYLA